MLGPAATLTRRTYRRRPLEADVRRDQPLYDRRIVSGPPAVTELEREREDRFQQEGLAPSVAWGEESSAPAAQSSAHGAAGISKSAFLDLPEVAADRRIQRTVDALSVDEDDNGCDEEDDDFLLTEEQLDKQSQVLLSVFKEFGIKLLLLPPADMDSLCAL